MIPTILIAVAAAAPTAAPIPAPESLAVDPVLATLVQEGADASEWTGSANVSAFTTSGNTEQDSFNFDLNAELRRDRDRYTAKGWLNYATESTDGTSTLTQRKMGTSLKYDYFLSDNEKAYLFANTGAEYDALADLDLRLQVGGGAGYQFVETDQRKFSGEAGVNYFIEDYEGVDNGDQYAALRLATNYFQRIHEDLVFTNSAEAYPSLEDAEDVYGKLDTKLTLNLTGSMISSLQWVMDYDNTPAVGKDRVDHRIVLSIGWSF